MFEQLFKLTKDFSIKNVFGDTFLHLLIASGFLDNNVENESAMAMVDACVPYINVPNNEGNTPIFEVKQALFISQKFMFFSVLRIDINLNKLFFCRDLLSLEN